MAGIDDVATNLGLGNQLMAKLITVISALFPRSIGTFTMAAAASKTITDGNVSTSSAVTLTATNAAAGTLMGSNKSLYITYASGSFTVTTASGVAAAGTETFQYVVENTL